MANFRETAQRLREIAETAAHLSADQKADLETAATTLCRLDQIKRDFVASAAGDDAASDHVALEIISLLGLQVRS